MPSRVRRLILLVVAGSVGMTGPALAGDVPENIIRAYGSCLLAEARNGDYSSFDGGKSALRLMAQCFKEWEAYENACHQSGSQDFQCNAASAAMAQVTLKRLGK
jgi:hypothetical protein